MTDALVPTRRALHALAERVISPLRVQATGNEIALEARPGGFGTPALPGGGWVGVVGTDVVAVEAGGAEMRFPITTLRAAAEALGLDGADALPTETLTVDPSAAARLAATWARGDAALRTLVAAAEEGDDPSEIHLWPEHFDIAVEIGPETARATVGVSPGDDDHDEPYAYVAPWTAPADAGPPLWQARGFTGAEAPAEDADAIVAFWRERLAALRRAP